LTQINADPSDLSANNLQIICENLRESASQKICQSIRIQFSELQRDQWFKRRGRHGGGKVQAGAPPWNRRCWEAFRYRTLPSTGSFRPVRLAPRLKCSRGGASLPDSFMDAPTCWRPGLAKTRFALLILAARPPQRVAASGICVFDKKCPVVKVVQRFVFCAKLHYTITTGDYPAKLRLLSAKICVNRRPI